MKIEDRPIVHEQQNINVAEKAKEVRPEMGEEDLAGVSGGSFIKNRFFVKCWGRRDSQRVKCERGSG